ncbi:BQ2448_6760 [Microbotryum intermedium]|uniref:NAD-dependent protein deacetylase n=1 Tax=Microbotryum intermedium TaxID=269621 RepID=A0A238FSX0_9BASI|nr:BQ2448_6760 [Microbotryum intermedium]
MRSATPTALAKTFPDVAPGKRPGLKHVAQLIKQGKAKNIIAGAGISTAAGIPDFRSPETGLYANLEKYNLPYPEAIFDIDYFLEKPQAFYTLAKELYPGNFRPTTTHHFFRLLQDKGVLKAVFTQNIDTLERIVGVDDDKLIEAHGSFETAQCLACREEYSKESIKPQIEKGEVVYCSSERCKGNKKAFVKPNIVFFGEGLPEHFLDRISDFASCDLLIVLGTSLLVQPFASLINRVPSHCPRLLINLESVGELSESSSRFLGSRGDGFDFEDVLQRRGGVRDVRYLGQSDEGVLGLVRELGWEEELEGLREGWERTVEGEGKEVDVEETVKEVREAPESPGESATDGDVEQLTTRLEKVEVEEEEEEETRLKDPATPEPDLTADRAEAEDRDEADVRTITPEPGKAIL